MDGQRFDEMTRALARGASRRGVLKGLAGGIFGGAAAVMRHSGMAADKVPVCHMTGSATNPVVLINVSTNAIPAHEAHGDVINPDFQNDVNNCGGCLISCDDGDPCTIDTCEAGVCVNTPMVCTSSNPCMDSACVGGSCVDTPAVGRSCDDGNACTENDACDATGACVGSPIDCSGLDDQCLVGVCNSTNGACEPQPANEGQACTAASGVAGTCASGACAPNHCDNAILAGSADGSAPIIVDDDLNVYVNGMNVFSDTNEFASTFPSIALGSVTNGDEIRVVANNSPSQCGYESLSPLYLICQDSGAVQELDATGFPQESDKPCGEVFYDRTFTVAI